MGIPTPPVPLLRHQITTLICPKPNCPCVEIPAGASLCPKCKSKGVPAAQAGMVKK